MWRFLVLLAIVLVFSHCGDNNLAKYSVLDTLRVLAMPANQPEVAPGATVTLTPFLSDVPGVGRALTYSVEACVDPGIEYGAVPNCQDNPTRVSLITDAPATGLAAPSFTGSVSSFNVTVPATILLGRTPADKMNGVAYLVFYKVSAADGTSVTSMKRVYASERPVKNKNPGATGMFAAGAALSTYLTTEKTKLTVTLAPDAIETYTVALNGGQTEDQTESPLVSWFITDGELSDDKVVTSRDTEWTLPKEKPTTRPVTVVAIIRDRRGGESFLQTNL